MMKKSTMLCGKAAPLFLGYIFGLLWAFGLSAQTITTIKTAATIEPVDTFPKYKSDPSLLLQNIPHINGQQLQGMQGTLDDPAVWIIIVPDQAAATGTGNKGQAPSHPKSKAEKGYSVKLR